MEELHTTRTELLQRRLQINLAQQGRDLLEKKRDALLIEFMKIMEEVLGLSSKLRKTAAEANFSLAVAQAVDGTVNLRSAAMATHGGNNGRNIRHPHHGRAHSRSHPQKCSPKRAGAGLRDYRRQQPDR